MSRSSDSSLLERSTSPSRSNVSDTTTSSPGASSDTRSRSPSPHADRTGLPMPSLWASPYGPPLGHYPMPIMGYPFPPFRFPPPPYLPPHPMGYPPPRHLGPSRKSTKRENQHLQNQVRGLERQLKKQQPKRPRPASPQRQKRSRSTSPERNARPRKHFTEGVAKGVKRPGHRDPHNTPATTRNPGGFLRSTRGHPHDPCTCARQGDHHARARPPRQSALSGLSGPHTPEVERVLAASAQARPTSSTSPPRPT